MAKKDDNKKALPAFEDYLAPWEVDDNGEKLDEPAEIDAARIKKHLYNLLSDKEKLNERVVAAEGERDQVKDDLQRLQSEHENDEQRRAREEKEREQREAEREKKLLERDKIDALEEAFEEQGITSKQAKLLAKRVSGKDADEWVEDAKELVDNGFRIGAKAEKPAGDEDDDPDDDISARPRRVRRSDGSPVEERGSVKPKSVGDELTAAGIGDSGW